MSLSDVNIQTAVNAWILDPTTAEQTYGHISNWDVRSVTNMKELFKNKGTFNGDISNWDVSNVTDMTSMFRNATNFNGDILNWDVSKVTDMGGMFYAASNFNGDISNWDTSSVTNMSYMFTNANNFDRDIARWDVSSVTYMQAMFHTASNFNRDISNWDVSNVTNMSGMFYAASSFNKDISNWDVSNVTNMSWMFNNATKFNGDLSCWDVANVTDMRNMFKSATEFYGNKFLTNWNTSSVNNMEYMFDNATNFNGDVSGWDTGNVTLMRGMFLGATSFNGDVSGWNVSKVTKMESMFNGAISFNRDVSGWDTTNIISMVDMFNGASAFNNDISELNMSNVDDFTNAFTGTSLSDQNKFLINTKFETNTYWEVGYDGVTNWDSITINSDGVYAYSQEIEFVDHTRASISIKKLYNESVESTIYGRIVEKGEAQPDIDADKYEKINNGSYSGTCTYISKDGKTMAITSNDNIVTIYRYNNNSWEELGNQLTSEFPSPGFGHSLSLSDDGQILAVGDINNNNLNGENAGRVTVYIYNGNFWIKRGSDIDGLTEGENAGWSVSLSGDGNRISIGSIYNADLDSGYVRVFKYVSGIWNIIGSRIVPKEEDSVGRQSVSLNYDGSVLAIGTEVIANHSAIIYVKENPSTILGDNPIGSTIVQGVGDNQKQGSVLKQYFEKVIDGLTIYGILVSDPTNNEAWDASTFIKINGQDISASNIHSVNDNTGQVKIYYGAPTTNYVSRETIYHQNIRKADSETSVSLSHYGDYVAIGVGGNTGESGTVRLIHLKSDQTFDSTVYPKTGQGVLSNKTLEQTVSISSDGRKLAIGSGSILEITPTKLSNGEISYSSTMSTPVPSLQINKMYIDMIGGNIIILTPGVDANGKNIHTYKFIQSNKKTIYGEESVTLLFGNLKADTDYTIYTKYNSKVRTLDFSTIKEIKGSAYKAIQIGQCLALHSNVDKNTTQSRFAAERPYSQDTMDAMMGYAVDFSSDGNIMAVGSPDYGKGKYGMVQVFKKKYIRNEFKWEKMGFDIIGPPSMQYYKNNWRIDYPSRTPTKFGSSISLSGDGTVLAIGAYADYDLKYTSEADDPEGTLAFNSVDYTPYVYAYRGRVRLFRWREYTSQDAGTYTHTTRINQGAVTDTATDVTSNIYKKPIIITDIGVWSAMKSPDTSNTSPYYFHDLPKNFPNAVAPVVGEWYWTQIGGDLLDLTSFTSGTIGDGEMTVPPKNKYGKLVNLSSNGKNLFVSCDAYHELYNIENDTITHMHKSMGETSYNGSYCVSINKDNTILARGGGGTILYTLIYANGYWEEFGNIIINSGTDGSSIAFHSLSEDGKTIAFVTSNYIVKVYKHNGFKWEQFGTDIYRNKDDGYFGGSHNNNYQVGGVKISNDGLALALCFLDGLTNKNSIKLYSYTDRWVQLGSDFTRINAGSNTDTQYYFNIKFNNYRTFSIMEPKFSSTYSGRTYGSAGKVSVYQLSANYETPILESPKEEYITNNQLCVSSISNYSGTLYGVILPKEHTGVPTAKQLKLNSAEQLGSTILGESTGDMFGHCIASNTSGKIIATSSIINKDGTDYSGHVRVFEWKVYTQTDKDNNSYHYSNRLQNATQNKSIIITDNYSEPAVGEYYWIQLGKDIDGSMYQQFGYSMGISDSGHRIAIGAIHSSSGSKVSIGSVEIYDYNVSTNVWTRKTTHSGDFSGDMKGWSVKLSGNGQILAVSMPYYDPSGGNNRGRVSVRSIGSSGTGTTVHHLDGTSDGELFGFSIDMDTSGDKLAVGSINSEGNNITNSGKVEVFYSPTSGRYSVAEPIYGKYYDDLLGWSVSLSGDGYTVAISSKKKNSNDKNSGSVRVYKRFSGSSNSYWRWTKVGQDLSGENENDLFGYSISLNDSGNILAIGAIGKTTNDGGVTIYKYNNTYWEKYSYSILGEPNSKMGWSVSLSGTGDNLVVSSPHANDKTGSVKVFKFSSGQNFANLLSDSKGYLYFNNLDSNKEYKVYMAIDNGTFDSDIMGPLEVKTYKPIQKDAYKLKQLGQDIYGKFEGARSGEILSLSTDGETIAISSYGKTNTDNPLGYNGIIIYHWREFLKTDVPKYSHDQTNTPFVITRSPSVSPIVGEFYWIQLGNTIYVDQSGTSTMQNYVTLSENGNIVAISLKANSADNKIYIYKYDGKLWDFLGDSIDNHGNYQMGYRMTIFNSGQSIFVGGYYDAFIYNFNSSNWQLKYIIDIPVSSSLYDTDISGNGQIAVTMLSGGSILLYKLKYDRYTQFHAFTNPSSASHHQIFALSGDGSTIAIAHSHVSYPSLIVYKIGSGSDDSIVQIGSTLYNSSAFGNVFSLKLSNNGETLVIAQRGTTSGGAVEIYKYYDDWCKIGWNDIGWNISTRDLLHSYSNYTFTSGQYLSISPSGETLAISGKNGTTTDRGITRVYKLEADYEKPKIMLYSIEDIESNTFTIDITPGNSGKIYWKVGQNNTAGEQELLDNDTWVYCSDIKNAQIYVGDLSSNTTYKVSILLYNSTSYSDILTFDVKTITGANDIDANDLTLTQLGNSIYGLLSNDKFGWSVSLSQNGEIVAIGSYKSNNGTSNEGAKARMFKYDTFIKKWIQFGQTIESPSSGYMEQVISLNSSGNIVAIGSANLTQIYKYDELREIWVQLGENLLNSADSISLSSSGEIVILTNTAAHYIYRFNGVSWISLGVLQLSGSQLTRKSVDISENGDIVALGYSHVDTYTYGRVVVYKYDVTNNITSWKQMGSNTIDSGVAGDGFGHSVSLSLDGNTIAVGSPYSNSSGPSSGQTNVYFFDKDADLWKPLGSNIKGESPGNQSGISVSLDSSGKMLAIGANLYNSTNGFSSGHVRVYKYESDWTLVYTAIDGDSGNNQSGWSVELSKDGSKLAVGEITNSNQNGRFSGQVKIYEIKDTNYTSNKPTDSLIYPELNSNHGSTMRKNIELNTEGFNRMEIINSSDVIQEFNVYDRSNVNYLLHNINEQDNEYTIKLYDGSDSNVRTVPVTFNYLTSSPTKPSFNNTDFNAINNNVLNSSEIQNLSLQIKELPSSGILLIEKKIGNDAPIIQEETLGAIQNGEFTYSLKDNIPKDGEYNIEFKVKDLIGNVSESISIVFIYDGTSPTINYCICDTATYGENNINYFNDIDFQGGERLVKLAGSENLTLMVKTNDDSLVDVPVENYSFKTATGEPPHYEFKLIKPLTASPSDEHRYQFALKDAAGNISDLTDPFIFKYDNTPPTTPVVPNSIVGQISENFGWMDTITVAGETGNTMKVKHSIDSGDMTIVIDPDTSTDLIVPEDGSGNYQFTIPKTLVDGIHKYEFMIINRFNNSSSSGIYEFTLINTKPEIPDDSIINSPNNPIQSTGDSLPDSITFNVLKSAADVNITKIHVYNNDTEIGILNSANIEDSTDVTLNSTGQIVGTNIYQTQLAPGNDGRPIVQYKFNIPKNLDTGEDISEGNYKYQFKVKDSLNNESTLSKSYQFTIDNTAPVIEIVPSNNVLNKFGFYSEDGFTFSDGGVTYTDSIIENGFTITKKYYYNNYSDSGNIISVSEGNNGNDILMKEEGNVTFVYNVTDLAGNKSLDAYKYFDINPPTDETHTFTLNPKTWTPIVFKVTNLPTKTIENSQLSNNINIDYVVFESDMFNLFESNSGIERVYNVTTKQVLNLKDDNAADAYVPSGNISGSLEENRSTLEFLIDFNSPYEILSNSDTPVDITLTGTPIISDSQTIKLKPNDWTPVIFRVKNLLTSNFPNSLKYYVNLDIVEYESDMYRLFSDNPSIESIYNMKTKKRLEFNDSTMIRHVPIYNLDNGLDRTKLEFLIDYDTPYQILSNSSVEETITLSSV